MSFPSSKKRNTQASPMPNKYSGPVKNNFTSVHAKLAILRSSFKPQGSWHVGKTLIDSHMEAHKKRVETAKACVDTCTPKAMADSTKGKRVWVDGMLRSSTTRGRPGQPLHSRKLSKVVQFREDLLDTSLSGTSEGGEELTDGSKISLGSIVNNDSVSTGAVKSEAPVPKAQSTYITRTARLTTAYKERQGSKQCVGKTADAHNSPPPWRPVYPEQAHFKHYPGFSISSLHSIDQDNLFTPKKQTVFRATAKVGAKASSSPIVQQEGNDVPSERRSPLANKGSQRITQVDVNRTYLVEGIRAAGGDTHAEEMSAAAPDLPLSEQSEPGVDSSSGTPPYVEDFEDESGADESLDSSSSSQDSRQSPVDPVVATPIQPAHLQCSSATVCTGGALPSGTITSVVIDAAKISDTKASGMTVSGVMTSNTSYVTTSNLTISDMTTTDMTTSDMTISGVMGSDAPNSSNSLKSTGVMMCHHAMSGAGSEPLKRESDYLAFVARVTQDILARGVYTDTGLKLLFEEHIERNRELLDMSEMQKRIQLLAKSLNVS